MTLPHHNTDGRGNRRTFSVSSAPLGNEIRFATKLFEKSSSFKTELETLKVNDVVTIGQLNGAFVLPSTATKFVWIAGGIGITPFVSMARDMIETKTHRDVTVFYLIATAGEYAYQDVWTDAKQYGLKIVPILTGPADPVWKGLSGSLTPELIQKEVPDFKARHFYLSGPHGLVVFFNQTLRKLSLKRAAIHSDFFSGY
jgi:ferredoxin-NADP reductase